MLIVTAYCLDLEVMKSLFQGRYKFGNFSYFPNETIKTSFI